MSPPLLDQWRAQTDLFSALHGYLSRNLFLSGSGEPEIVPTADITVGLIELLGARPRWGRSFVAGDEQQIDLQPALIAYALALERFGNPVRAVGQRLETTGESLLVVGVMPADFRFPEERYRIWRALDPRGPFARGADSVRTLARLTPGVSQELAASVMAQRSAAVGAAAATQPPYTAQPGTLPLARAPDEQRRLFLALLGAAVCLLLVACANVASLELATAVDRAHTFAIQLSLGAPRLRLAGIAAAEGLVMTAGATALGAWFAHVGIGSVATWLPVSVLRGGPNPVDVDARALMFMALVAAVAWVLSSLPVVLFSARIDLVTLLKQDGHGVSASTWSGTIRRLLTSAEVAVAVMLLVTGVAYVRSYQALLAQEKGFDSAGVVSIGLTIPPQAYSGPGERHALRRLVLDRVRTRPGVLAASDTSAPPHGGRSYEPRALQIDGRPLINENINIAELDVEPEYFSVLRIPLLAGRLFEPGDPPTNVIVSETFASRYWPGHNAVGRSYRPDPKGTWRHIIGIAAHVRTVYDPPGGRTDRVFQTYYLRQPPPLPARSSRPPTRATGGSYGILSLLARVDSRNRLGDLGGAIRAIDSRFILKLEFVDDAYASQYAGRLIATRVVGGFGSLSFLIAAAGIYGVMSFLVAQRRREIGVRVALGATRRDVERLVIGSALRLVLAGSVTGIAAAYVGARWIESQLYGVRALDPAALAAVTVAVAGVALLATWHPARRAADVDPTVLLR